VAAGGAGRTFVDVVGLEANRSDELGDVDKSTCPHVPLAAV